MTSFKTAVSELIFQSSVAILGIFIQYISYNTQQTANYLLGRILSLSLGEAWFKRQENFLREWPGWERKSAPMMCGKPNTRKITPSPA